MRKDRIQLFNINGHFVRHISPAEARALEHDGQVYLSYKKRSDTIPTHARLINPRRELNLLSPTAITAREMEANAGAYFGFDKNGTRLCHSRTLNMSESKKRELESAGRNAEDFTERTLGKIALWNELKDDKAVLA
jgi:hypothetical protein